MNRVLPARTRGFTLVELVTVMAIVAILTAIALPNYWAYVARSNRSEARSQLLIAANWMERWRTQQGSYLGLPVPPLPIGLRQSPAQGVAKYNIVLSNVTAVTYRIDAQPAGSMAGDMCGELRIDQTGQRTLTGGGQTQDFCWGR